MSEYFEEIINKGEKILKDTIDNLNDILKRKFDFEFEIKSRVKSIESQMRKRYYHHLNEKSFLSQKDLLGIRIVVDSDSEINDIFTYLYEKEFLGNKYYGNLGVINHYQNEDSEIEGIFIQFIKKTGENSYNSDSLFYIEIQIITEEMDRMIELTHDEYLERVYYSKKELVDFVNQLHSFYKSNNLKRGIDIEEGFESTMEWYLKSNEVFLNVLFSEDLSKIIEYVEINGFERKSTTEQNGRTLIKFERNNYELVINAYVLKKEKML